MFTLFLLYSVTFSIFIPFFKATLSDGLFVKLIIEIKESEKLFSNAKSLHFFAYSVANPLFQNLCESEYPISNSDFLSTFWIKSSQCPINFPVSFSISAFIPPKSF